MPDAHRRPNVVLFGIIGGLLTVWGAGLFAVRADAPLSPKDAASTFDGRELFTTYCASCHGTDGGGNGPAAAAMRRKPPDLTGLAIANGGMFPWERLRRIVDGRDVEAHGDRDMPVWGDAFKVLRDGHSEEAVRARIAAILKHVAAIQRRHA